MSVAILTREAPINTGNSDQNKTVAIAKILGGLYALVSGEQSARPLDCLKDGSVSAHSLAAELFAEIGTTIKKIILVGTTKTNLSGWDDFREHELAEALAHFGICAEVTTVSEAAALQAYFGNNLQRAYFILDQAAMTAKWFVTISSSCLMAKSTASLVVSTLPGERDASICEQTIRTINGLLKETPRLTSFILWSHQGFSGIQLDLLLEAMIVIIGNEQRREVCMFASDNAKLVLLGALIL